MSVADFPGVAGRGRQGVPTFESWRRAVRPLLSAGLDPAEVDWGMLWNSPASSVDGDRSIRLPRSLMQLLQNLACFRHPGRWELMYRLAWRTHYRNPRLLEDAADPDVAHAETMSRAVRRDIHKMHAFVRFREIATAEGTSYFAWFEPQHEILHVGAKFFARRFPNMLWTIATPDGAACWSGKELEFLDSPQTRPSHSDPSDELWRTYYRNICNVARVNPAAMRREMPQHYWRNLPEAAEIGPLIREGLARFEARQRESPEPASIPAGMRASLEALRVPEDGLQQCRRCELWKHATQAVEGRGAATARLMLVGEQPGDEEDLRGEPFVGPAGRVLDEALAAAGIARETLFVTNAVKHFKWEPRGKRRLHKRPDLREVQACGVWLDAEIARVRPRVIVALGATALRALGACSLTIEAARAAALSHPCGARVMATYHPSAILRADGAKVDAMRDALIADLTRAAGAAADTLA